MRAALLVLLLALPSPSAASCWPERVRVAVQANGPVRVLPQEGR